VADVVSEQQPRPLAHPKADPVVSRRKFGAAYLLLAVIVGAAVGLIVVLATEHDHHEAQSPWSSFAPSATGTIGAREIARHVSGEYHLENGALLTSVIAGPMEIQSSGGPVPVTAILIRSGSAGVTQERIDIAFPEAGVFYQLTGTGANRSIPGAATKVRGQLVRREATELALYTFRYLPQADYVLAFLPPPANTPQTSPYFNRAVLLSREALRDELGAGTVEQALPPGSVKMRPAELTAAQGNAIDGLTSHLTFHYDFQQAADNGVLVVLSPLP